MMGDADSVAVMPDVGDRLTVISEVLAVVVIETEVETAHSLAGLTLGSTGEARNPPVKIPSAIAEAVSLSGELSC